MNASLLYLAAAAALALVSVVRRASRARDFELGVAAGLLAAWMLGALGPLMAELP